MRPNRVANRPVSCTTRLVAVVVALAVPGATLLPVATRVAHAQPAADLEEGLEPSLAVLELYVAGQDYEKTPEYVRSVAEEIRGLGRYAMLARPDAERQVRQVMTTSSRRIADARLAEIERMMEEGDRLVYTNPQKAIEILAKAKGELKSIMETISLNQEIRRDFFTTQMLLARSHYDNGNRDKAAGIMEEIIKVFGDEYRVTAEEYHPDIVALYRETYRRLSEQRKGRLTVRTEPPGAEVFINGKQQQKKTPATYEGLYAGTLTVAARKGGRESMNHKVQIEEGRPAEVTIDIDYETSLAFNDDRFGFVFSNHETLDRRVADFASRIGSLLDVDYVLVAGLVEREGRTYLEGHLVNVAGQKVVKRHALYTKSNVVSNNRVTQMARLMAGVDVDEPMTVYKPWYQNWVGWTLVGAGVAAAGAGAGMYFGPVQSKIDDAECAGGPAAGCKPFDERSDLADEAETQRAVSGVLVGLGAAAIVGGAVAFMVMEEEDPDGMAEADTPHLRYVGPTVAPGGTAGFGMGAGFSF
ncbi:MAG: PEGA domain-containing protein [Myxococcota bacterium]